jgi:hypothetical protein
MSALVKRKYPYLVSLLVSLFYVIPRSLWEVFGEAFIEGLEKLPAVVRYRKVQTLYTWEGKAK